MPLTALLWFVMWYYGGHVSAIFVNGIQIVVTWPTLSLSLPCILYLYLYFRFYISSVLNHLQTPTSPGSRETSAVWSQRWTWWKSRNASSQSWEKTPACTSVYACITRNWRKRVKKKTESWTGKTFSGTESWVYECAYLNKTLL